MLGSIQERIPEWDSDRAVSPVIGVILMVAVVVVLAAVVTAFVFGIGDDLDDTQPTVDIDYDYDASNAQLQVIHDGGDTLNENNVGALTLLSDNSELDNSGGNLTANTVTVDDPNNDPNDDQPLIFGEDDEVTSGDIIVEYVNETSDLPDDMESGVEFALRWESDDGDTSEVLATYTIPQDAEDQT